MTPTKRASKFILKMFYEINSWISNVCRKTLVCKLWPQDIWPTDICQLDIWPLAILPFNIWPLDILPLDLFPLDIWPLFGYKTFDH
jgi:hypothetical protein